MHARAVVIHMGDDYMIDPVTAFADAITAAGLGRPAAIIPDGVIHRYHVDGDKPGTKNGWYVLYLDRVPAGAFGGWKLGHTNTWCAKDRDQMTPMERHRLRSMVEQAKRQRDTELMERYRSAAEEAAQILEGSAPADPAHPYLVAKGIRPHGIRQQDVGLIVPVSVAGKLSSVQTIYPDGTKRFLKGGRMSGGAFLINDAVTRPEILIAEGFATSATLHEEIGAAVWCAFNANNLRPVAERIRKAHPWAEIIICGDNDQWTDGNPGRAKAREAALAIGGKVLVPDFTDLDLSGKPTDWNDWYSLRRAAA